MNYFNFYYPMNEINKHLKWDKGYIILLLFIIFNFLNNFLVWLKPINTEKYEEYNFQWNSGYTAFYSIEVVIVLLIIYHFLNLFLTPRNLKNQLKETENKLKETEANLLKEKELVEKLMFEEKKVKSQNEILISNNNSSFLEALSLKDLNDRLLKKIKSMEVCQENLVSRNHQIITEGINIDKGSSMFLRPQDKRSENLT